MSPASKKPVSGAAPVKAGDSILVSDDTLFETPALGVFISKNGALQRGVVKSGKVKPLEALASTLNGRPERTL